MLSLTVACPSCKPVCYYSWETISLWDEFGYGELWHGVSSLVHKETRRILSLAVSWFLCPDGSGQVPLARNLSQVAVYIALAVLGLSM